MRLGARTGLKLPLPSNDAHEGHREKAECQAEDVTGGAPGPAHSPATMHEADAYQDGAGHSAEALSALERRGRPHHARGRLLAGDGRPGVPGGENGGEDAAPPRLDESSDDEGYHEEPRESLNPAVPYQALLPDNVGANRPHAQKTHKRSVRRGGPEDAMSSSMPITLRRLALAALVLTSACGGGDFMAPFVAGANTLIFLR